MSPLWPLYIEPFIRRVAPSRVMQVGAGDGDGSLRLLAYCREGGCVADLIDVRADPSLGDKLAPFADLHVFTRLLPLKAIQMAEHPDLVVIEGEPNWSTISRALDLFRRLGAERGRPYPFALIRNTGWPYGRRDMYPKPDAVEEKHPFAYQGVDPDQQGLVEGGINAGFAHALHEGGPQNGVLTAIEDFIANAPFEVDFWSLPYFGGLGILAPRSRTAPELKALVDSFFTAEALTLAGHALEAETFGLQARLAEAESRLARRTGALKRARELLDKQDAQISALSKQLGAKSKAGG